MGKHRPKVKNEVIKQNHNDYPRKFYAFLDKIEEISKNKYQLHFGSIAVSDYENIDTSRKQDVLKIKTHAIFIILKVNELVRRLGVKKDIENKWFFIELTDKRNRERASLYSNSISPLEPTIVFDSYIEKIELLEGDIQSKLLNYFSLNDFDNSSIKQIKEALQIDLNGYPINYNVYNVGQGNFTAICDNQNIPQIYIDMGGGVYQNSSTYREVLNICNTSYTAVVLTHWDTDHFQTALKNINLIRDKNWIVPRQLLGPQQLQFLQLLLGNNNNILVFEENLPLITNNCTLIKCNGISKNDSGIALIIHIDPKMNILNPGDAVYQHIPHLDEFIINGLVATHHGAQTSLIENRIPAATEPKRIVYSFGLGNHYGHVKPNSEKFHYNRGWVNKLVTLNSNVGFSNSQNGLYLDVPCNGVCDLGEIKGFN